MFCTVSFLQEMDALMSHIMQRASGVKRPAEDLPLDLTQPKLLRHTRDSFVDHTDLRAGSDYNSVLDADSISPKHKIKSETDASENTPAAHPFSIEAILGDMKDSESVMSSTPAIVYSSYCSRNPCITNESHDVVKTNEREVETCYWCHACNCFCTDNINAQGHQYLHYMQGIGCDLKKDLLRKHGYVTKHIKINSELVQCGLCNTTVSFSFFSKHQKLHCGHFCNICKKEFSSLIHLQDHMNVHTGSTPFSCKICDRKFAKRSSLTQHQRYHRDNQRYKCTYCHKSFNSKYTRAVHERLHTGEKPFKCQEPGCRKAFPQKIQLQLHMNSHYI